jgi:hypothetical protein
MARFGVRSSALERSVEEVMSAPSEYWTTCAG